MWDKPASGTLQYFDHLFHSFRKYIWRRHVNLRVGMNKRQSRGSYHDFTLVIHTTTGTLKASAMARCSLDIPINPALAPTMRTTQDGAPDVKP